MALDVETYPRPRIPRAGPTPTSLTPGEPGTMVSPPQLRVFSFMLNSAATTRSTVSSPRLKGPALLRGWSYAKGGAAVGTSSFELGIAASAVNENDVAIGLARGWKGIFEPITGTGVGDTAGRVGDIMPDLAVGLHPDSGFINIPILETEFFITVTVTSHGAAVNTFAGYVVIAESVAPEVIANFL